MPPVVADRSIGPVLAEQISDLRLLVGNEADDLSRFFFFSFPCFCVLFDFMYGILFDDGIITRKTRKSHRNTENIKNRLDGTHVVPSPVPHTEPTETQIKDLLC